MPGTVMLGCSASRAVAPFLPATTWSHRKKHASRCQAGSGQEAHSRHAVHQQQHKQAIEQQLQARQAPPTRRDALVAALAAAVVSPWPLCAEPAWADNEAVKAGLSKYVKKKKLERIDTYIPPLLEAKSQLVRVGRVMLQDPAAARQLLRSGVFSGLRDNVRSLGEYASQRSGDSVGTELVRGFFTELEGFDASLRTASRNDNKLPDDARPRLEAVIVALDRLLATVPEDVMAKAQEVVTAIQLLDEEAVEDSAQLESQVNQLKKLL